MNSNLSLRNQKILVTRSWQQAPEFTQKLLALGAKVIELPTLIITPPDSWQALDTSIHNLASYNWLILTSANGVYSFCDRLFHLGKTIEELATIKIAVVGAKTAEALQKYNITADLMPTNFIADDLIVAFQASADDLKHQNILFPRVQSGSRDLLIQQLTKLGAIVTAVPAYESRCPEFIDPTALTELQTGTLNFITFTSSKTVHNFCNLCDRTFHPNEWQLWLKNCKLISIGAQTSLTCVQCLGRVDLEAEVSTLDGMIAGLLKLVDPPISLGQG